MYVDQQPEPVSGTPRQADLLLAAQARGALRQALVQSRLQTRYVSFDVWQALRAEHPALFEGVGRTWRTTTREAQALLTVIIDDIYGRQGCKHNRGYLKIPGEDYLAPLFGRAEPLSALYELEMALDLAGVAHDRAEYAPPYFDKQGKVRAIKLTYGPATTEAVRAFRRGLKKGILETPIRLDSPTGKPRSALPPQRIAPLKERDRKSVV